MIFNILAVGLGGFIGSVLRYLMGLLPVKNPVFPYKTLIINVLGCFLIAVFTALVLKKNLSPRTALLIKTGFCGGFTTFSTFSLEAWTLFQSGHTGLGVLYLLASVIPGLAAVALGFLLVK